MPGPVFHLINSTVLIALIVTGFVSLLRLRRVEMLYRRQLLATQPSPGQVWEQDGQPLYVVAVAPAGIRWSLQHPLTSDYRPQVSSHLDSWDEWRTRLTHRDMVLHPYHWSKAA